MDQKLLGLGRFRRRVRLARSWRGLATGGALGAALAAVWAGLDYLGWFYTEWAWIGILTAATALLGAIVGCAWPIRDEALGDSIDRRAGLKNRLGTALQEPDGDPSFLEAQRADALTRFSELKPARVYPLRLTQGHVLFAALCGLAALLFALGNMTVFLGKEKQREKAELQEAATRVERVAKPIVEEKDAAAPEVRAIAGDLKQLAREMKKGRIDKEDALQKADEIARKADELSRQKYTEADNLVNDAETAYDKALKEELDRQGLKGADVSAMKSTEAENSRSRQALEQEIKDLERKQQNSQGKSAAEKDAIRAQLDKAKKDLQTLQLSEQARKTFEKLFAMKEYQDLRKLASQLKNKTDSGKQGQDKLTKEQIMAMQKQLEELAKKLRDEKAMRDYIQKLREALKKAQGG